MTFLSLMIPFNYEDFSNTLGTFYNLIFLSDCQQVLEIFWIQSKRLKTENIFT